MQKIIRKKREDEKNWKKELWIIKSIPHHNECWFCSKCEILFEQDDAVMYWEGQGKNKDYEIHCSKCNSGMSGGPKEYFEENYVLSN